MWMWQVVQALHPAALPGLRDAYTQALNVVIRKELRLYSSSLRKAAAAAAASGPSEPDKGMAHKKVTCASHSMLFVPVMAHGTHASPSRHADLCNGGLSNACT